LGSSAIYAQGKDKRCGLFVRWHQPEEKVMATVKGTEEKAMQTVAEELDMWSFYQPGDWPVAKTNADFIWFLLSPGTQSLEIVGFDCDHITFALYGPPGDDGVPGVVRKTLERGSMQSGERKFIVAAINERYPGDRCEKRRMARTVAAYFEVPWKVGPWHE
jgi:hypothetical protein